MVDTCAGEFEAKTPYFYSTVEPENDATPSDKKKVIVIGSGPNRIGQGVEFDYCCVHAVQSLHEMGYEAIMVNNNPETVSTDYDTSDRLYFEPITGEDVINIYENEKPLGVILQFGGQTPLNIVEELRKADVNILGTSPEAIHLAEDRKKFGKLLKKLGIRSPTWDTATNTQEAVKVADKIGYPVMVRPSFVLGGQGMAIVYDEQTLRKYAEDATRITADYPMLIDKFLEKATELEVDAVCDGEDVYISAIMQHIEHAGIHSGDSSCVTPPISIIEKHLETVKEYTKKIALGLKTLGLINIQYAISDNVVYIIEANPRASRTVPYVSKATGVPIAKVASKVIMGHKLKDLKEIKAAPPKNYAVKMPVFSSEKIQGHSPPLGPQMRSTGEVMGLDESFGKAYQKALMAVGANVPETGAILVNTEEKDREDIVEDLRQLNADGFKLVAVGDTGDFLLDKGLDVEKVAPPGRGRPDAVDKIINGEIDLILDVGVEDERVQTSAGRFNIPQITTIQAAKALTHAIKEGSGKQVNVKALQEYYGKR